MKANDFADAPANAIAHHRAAKSSFDAETETGLRQVIRLRENGEVGIRTALPMAVNRVEVRLAHETCRRRIRQPGFIRV